MRHIKHIHNRQIHEREARLCFMSFDQKNEPSYFPEETSIVGAGWDGIKGFAQYMSERTGILSPEYLQNVDTVNSLNNHAEWIRAFSAPDFFIYGASEPLKQGEAFGPKEFLRSLTFKQRQEAYVTYVNAFIPLKIQEKEFGISAKEVDPEKRFIALEKSRGAVHGVLLAIYGMEDLSSRFSDQGINTEENTKRIARESLLSYYEMDSKVRSDFVSKRAQDDYAASLEHQKIQGVDAVDTDPKSILTGIGPSRFRGALMTGAIEQEDLELLAAGLSVREHQINLSRPNVAAELNHLTQATKEQYRGEAETLRDKFNNLGGLEKFLLIGAAIYALTNKTMRAAAVGLAAVYGIQYFALNDKDPLKTWSGWLGSVTGVAKDANSAVFGVAATPGFVGGVETRANAMINFLDDYSVRSLERQAIGFGILHDLPMNVLAQNFEMGGNYGEQLSLNTDDALFNKQIGDALGARGWSETRYREFFRDSENRVQVGEALGYVFFLQAMQNPNNKKKAELVLESLRMLPAGTSLSVFGAGAPSYAAQITDEAMRETFLLAHQQYIMLVAEGRVMAQNNTQTLGKFVQQAPGMEFVSAKTPYAGVSADDEPESGSSAEGEPKSGGAADAEPSSGTRTATEPQSGEAGSREPVSGILPDSDPNAGGNSDEFFPIESGSFNQDEPESGTL